MGSNADVGGQAWVGKKGRVKAERVCVGAIS